MNLTAFCQRCSKTATHVSDAFKCRFESISDAIYLILFDEKKDQQHGGGRSVNGPRASNVNGPVSGHGQVQGQEEGEVSAAHALSQAMAASLGMDVTSFLQMAASGSGNFFSGLQHGVVQLHAHMSSWVLYSGHNIDFAPPFCITNIWVLNYNA